MPKTPTSRNLDDQSDPLMSASSPTKYQNLDKFTPFRLKILRLIDESGPKVDMQECLSRLVEQSRRTTAKWAAIKGETLGEGLSTAVDDALENGTAPACVRSLPRLFGFGYAMGYEVCRLTGGSSDESHSSGLVSGLVNMSLSIFDKVCDSTPEQLAVIARTLNPDTLGKAVKFRPTSSPDLPFEVPTSGSLTSRVLFRLLNAYFKRTALLLDGTRSPWLLNEMRETVMDSYTSQLKSMYCTFEGPYDHETILQVLSGKSVLPAWLVALTAFASHESKGDSGRTELKQAALDMGRVIWITDDLADINEDLIGQRWSYVWAKACFQYGIELPLTERLGRMDLPLAFANSGLAESISSDLVASLRRSLSVLGRLGDGAQIDEFERNLLAQVKVWILSGSLTSPTS
jgi:hypothetical protein